MVCKPIANIMNISMTNGCLPGDWKTAHIIPIYKNKGDKNQAVNYQPIAIHRLYAKCITLCIFSSRKNSHPFSSMASSKIDLRQLNFLILSINAVKVWQLEKWLTASILFCKSLWHRTSQKTFEKRLLWCQKLLRWITDFLKERFQLVNFNGKLS